MKVNILRKIEWFGGNYFHPIYFDETVFRMEGSLGVGKSVPPHYHRDFDEFWLVKKGNPVFVIGKEKFERKPGETFNAPKNVVHSFYNNGKEDVILQTEIRPCADMAKMMSIIAGLQDDGEKKWMFKYLYIERKEGLREFSVPTGLMMKVVIAVVMPIVMMKGKLSGWNKYLGKYV